MIDTDSARNDGGDEVSCGDVLCRDVPDAALERAAGAGPGPARAFTMNLCTVMADCSS